MPDFKWWVLALASQPKAASFVGLGTHRQRIVCYPISPPHLDTGLATINWIAEITAGTDLAAMREEYRWSKDTQWL